MNIWNNEDLENIFALKVKNIWQATGISIDSRTLKKGEIFLAIKGENFDGHDFILSAIKNGAVAVISSKDTDIKIDVPLYKVKDTLLALHELAKFHRHRVQAKYYAITGSVGKTSTKAMLEIALKKIGKTYATLGNFNNHIGLPLCLCNMPKDTEFAIFEMGMNHAHEIEPLSLIVKPDIAIITNVSEVHLEFFSSVYGIADAKLEILAGLNKNGYLILNADNEYFSYLKDQAQNKYKINKDNIISFGKSPTASIKALDLDIDADKTSIKCSYLNQIYEYKIGCVGIHQALNSLAVFAALALSTKEYKKALTALIDYQIVAGRGKKITLELKNGKVDFIDDSYNASPASIKASLKILALARGRKIAVLGDMFELGEKAAQLHSELAKDIIDNKIDMVFLAGSLMKNLEKSLPKSVKYYHVDNITDLQNLIYNNLKDGDTVLFKASHGMKMYLVVEELRKLII